ncbi:GIY-YIG nuclease family protein [Methylomicrobium lacus]|uniref:GIY-YIG nuclease family protein n=1 Tax=Methylomicrobium lacus TaxID=136992 RepID=UPI0035A924A3
MTKGYEEFEFDLPSALLINLVKLFDEMDSSALSIWNVASIPEEQGVYQLLHKDSLVYIGKTDAEAGLKKRLDRHAWTIQHRHNLDPMDVTFKAVRVFVFTAIDLETQLIKHYGAENIVSWNNSGFGSNDPGRERDTTTLKAEGFDELFPVDIDREIELNLSAPTSAADALKALKEALPYTFRFETAGKRSRKPHLDLTDTPIDRLPKAKTTRLIIETIVSQLPAGWQATALPSRVILYKEKRDYIHGTIIARSL